MTPISRVRRVIGRVGPGDGSEVVPARSVSAGRDARSRPASRYGLGWSSPRVRSGMVRGQVAPRVSGRRPSTCAYAIGRHRRRYSAIVQRNLHPSSQTATTASRIRTHVSHSTLRCNSSEHSCDISTDASLYPSRRFAANSPTVLTNASPTGPRGEPCPSLSLSLLRLGVNPFGPIASSSMTGASSAHPDLRNARIAARGPADGVPLTVEGGGSGESPC